MAMTEIEGKIGKWECKTNVLFHTFGNKCLLLINNTLLLNSALWEKDAGRKKNQQKPVFKKIKWFYS